LGGEQEEDDSSSSSGDEDLFMDFDSSDDEQGSDDIQMSENQSLATKASSVSGKGKKQNKVLIEELSSVEFGE